MLPREKLQVNPFLERTIACRFCQNDSLVLPNASLIQTPKDTFSVSVATPKPPIEIWYPPPANLGQITLGELAACNMHDPTKSKGQKLLATRQLALTLFEQYQNDPEGLLKQLNQLGVVVLKDNTITSLSGKLDDAVSGRIDGMAIVPKSILYPTDGPVLPNTATVTEVKPRYRTFSENTDITLLTQAFISDLDQNRQLGVIINGEHQNRGVLLHEVFHLLQAANGLSFAAENPEKQTSAGKLQFGLIPAMGKLMCVGLLFGGVSLLGLLVHKRWDIPLKGLLAILALSISSLGLTLAAKGLSPLLGEAKKRGWLKENPNSSGYDVRQNLQREFEVTQFMKDYALQLNLTTKEQQENMKAQQYYQQIANLSYLSDLWITAKQKLGK